MPDETRLSRRSVEVITCEIVLPTNTNSYGTMFGGDVLALMDKTAASVSCAPAATTRSSPSTSTASRGRRLP